MKLFALIFISVILFSGCENNVVKSSVEQSDTQNAETTSTKDGLNPPPQVPKL